MSPKKDLDHSHLFASVADWGIKKGAKHAFRPAMALSTGELSGLGGKLLMMTATATKKTMRVLQDQFPEVSSWKLLLNLPLRENVTVLVPPPDIISPKYERTLAPFITSMKEEQKTYLIIVRGINKGAAIYLHLLRELAAADDADRRVAFFHRNSSEDRKQAILSDLQLPLGSENKRIICVVATVSLGIKIRKG